MTTLTPEKEAELRDLLAQERAADQKWHLRGASVEIGEGNVIGMWTGRPARAALIFRTYEVLPNLLDTLSTERQAREQAEAELAQWRSDNPPDYAEVRAAKDRAEAAANLLADRSTELDWERSARQAAEQEVARLRLALAKQNEEISQTLGKALGYAWFKDDPKNFPDATEAEGVCVGEHIAESLADEAAKRLLVAEKEVERLKDNYDVVEIEVERLRRTEADLLTRGFTNGAEAIAYIERAVERGDDAEAKLAALVEKAGEFREWLERTRDERNFPAHLFGWCEEADARLNALSALPPPVPAEEGGWRPISTAPLDGTHVLLSFGQDHACEGWYEDSDGDPRPWKFIDRGCATPFRDGEAINASRDEVYGPSHWQPMPALWSKSTRPTQAPQDVAGLVEEDDGDRRGLFVASYGHSEEAVADALRTSPISHETKPLVEDVNANGPSVIWLQPLCMDTGGEGRLWMEDMGEECDCTPPCWPTKYVRADYLRPPAADNNHKALVNEAVARVMAAFEHGWRCGKKGSRTLALDEGLKDLGAYLGEEALAAFQPAQQAASAAATKEASGQSRQEGKQP